MATKDKFITMRIEPEIYDKLKEMADEERRSLTNLIQLILYNAVQNKEGDE